MGRIIAVEYLSLDGVFEDPAWTGPYFDDAVGAYQARAMAEADALLLGRTTWDGMSQAWPAMPEGTPGAAEMNAFVKYVPTTTLTEPTWNTTFLDGDADVIAAVAELKADGDPTLLVYGSGKLGESLRAAGLVDEYRLIIAPVVLGSGRRLFVDGTPSTFTLTHGTATPSGMVLLDLALA